MKLKGKKVILRPIRLTDAPRFVKWYSDPEVNQYLDRKSGTLKEIKKWITGLAKVKKTQHYFAIDAQDKIHIGSVAIFVNRINRCGGISIMIGDKNYWNNGYGTDATRTIINYGFNKLKLHRIQLWVFAYNPRAIKVYKNIGFHTEGIRREAVFYKHKFYDDIVMGLLEDEWKKLNKK